MSNPDRSATASTKCQNRILAIMAHITRYSFRGTTRLAADAGVSKSTISHLLRGLNNPLYITVRQVVKCLEFQLGRVLHCKEVMSLDGKYPTASVCQLCGFICGRRGCLPDSLYESDGSRKKGFESVVPGQWTGDLDEFKSPAKADPEDPGTE